MEQQQDHLTLSPQVIILKIIGFFKLIGKNWGLILLITIIGAAIGYYVDSNKIKRTQYIASITFNMGGNTGGGMGGDMGGLASLLGGGQRPDAGLFSGENFFFLMKSRPVIEKALLTEIEVGGKRMTFAQYYADSSFIREDSWLFLHSKPGIVIATPTRAKMPTDERFLFDEVYSTVKDQTEISQANIKTSFMRITTTMPNEMLAKTWAELLLDTIEDVYQQSQTRKSREMVKLMKNRVDSLANILNRSENRLARVTDLNLQTVVPTAKVEETKLSRSTKFVGDMYMQALQSLESLQMSIIRETPLFTIVEPVYLPLSTKNFTRENTIFGVVFGLVIGIIIVFLRQTYRDALKDVNLKTIAKQ